MMRLAKASLLAPSFIALGICTRVLAEDSAPGLNGIEAVSSKVAPDYVRAKTPDGSFQPELYAFGPGGNWGGEIKDLTIEKLTFLDVAHVIARPLAIQKYLPGNDPAKTRLLILVYWGTTAVPPPYEMDTLYRNYSQSVSESNNLIAQSQGMPPGQKEIILEEANDVLSAGLHQLQNPCHAPTPGPRSGAKIPNSSRYPQFRGGPAKGRGCARFTSSEIP